MPRPRDEFRDMLTATSAAADDVQSFQARLRVAAFAGITADDIAAIVRAQVERAKQGDQAALKFVFGSLLGGVQPPQPDAVPAATLAIHSASDISRVEVAARVRRANRLKQAGATIDDPAALDSDESALAIERRLRANGDRQFSAAVADGD